MFDDDIGAWLCEDEDKCVPRYDQKIYIPDFLFAEIETQILQVMTNTIKIPSEDSDNKQNINR